MAPVRKPQLVNVLEYVFMPKLIQRAMKADTDAVIEAFGKNEQVKKVFWTLFVAMAGLVLALTGIDPDRLWITCHVSDDEADFGLLAATTISSMVETVLTPAGAENLVTVTLCLPATAPLPAEYVVNSKRPSMSVVPVAILDCFSQRNVTIAPSTGWTSAAGRSSTSAAGTVSGPSRPRGAGRGRSWPSTTRPSGRRAPAIAAAAVLGILAGVLMAAGILLVVFCMPPGGRALPLALTLVFYYCITAILSSIFSAWGLAWFLAACGLVMMLTVPGL